MNPEDAAVVYSDEEREIVARMHGEVAKAMQAPDMRSRLTQLGDELSLSASPEQFTAFIRAEHAKWERIIRESGIKVE